MAFNRPATSHLGPIVIGVVLAASASISVAVAVTHTWCVARGLPVELMRSCETTGLTAYLVSIAVAIRVPVLASLAVGLSLLVSSRSLESSRLVRVRVSERGLTSIAAVLGIGVGLPGILRAARRGSVDGSLDFLWNVIWKFWQRKSPYRYEEGCFGTGLEIECLGYLHSYVLLFAPFALLSAEEAVRLWALVNLILVPLTAVALALAFRLKPLGAFILGGVTASAGSTVNVLTNGQTSLAVLLLIVGAPLLVRNEKIAGAVAALGMFKVSLFLPFIGVLAAAKRRVFVASLVASSVYGLFAVVWLQVSPIETIFGPLRIASELSGSGYASRSGGDVHRMLYDFVAEPTTLISALLGMTSAIMPWLIFRRSQDLGAAVAAASLSGLILFPHYPYDYVFALPVLAFALSRGLSPISGLLIASSSVLALSPGRILRFLEMSTGINLEGTRELFDWPMQSVAATWYLAINVLSLVVVLLLATRSAPSQRMRRGATLALGPRRFDSD